jgi:hypothetical protein
LLVCLKLLDGLSLFVDSSESLLNGFLKMVKGSEDVDGFLVLVPRFVIKVVP